MEAKFTPGPWEVRDDPGLVCDECQNEIFDAHAISQCGAYPACVATIQFGSSSEANAALIAAAPDLYNALNRIMDYAHTGASVKDIIPEDQPQFIAAYAALAKARGKT